MTELVNNIKQKLESAGFNCNVEDTSWTKEAVQMMGGGTISINGQVMQQQEKPVKISMLFDIVCETVVKDVETEVEVTQGYSFDRTLLSPYLAADESFNFGFSKYVI